MPYLSIQDREKVRASSSGKVDKSIDLVSEFVNELASLREALRIKTNAPLLQSPMRT
jgi:hypothetical protein